MGPRPPKAARRGDIYEVNPNPIAGREMRGWHNWIVLTPEAVNVHGVVVAVPVSTVALGAREVGLTVRIVADGVTGVAVCTHVRSFDLAARLQAGTARRNGTAPADAVDEISDRIAAMIAPPMPPAQPARPPRAAPAQPSPAQAAASANPRGRRKSPT